MPAQSQGLLTFPEAVNYLNALRLPLTFTQAAAYLRGRWHSANLLRLYRHYFPVEYAASTASSIVEIEHGGSQGLTCLYSPQEKEFVQLVEARLFPFYADNLLEEAEEREDVIYLPNFGVDFWSCEFEELHPGWQLLLLICGQVERGFVSRLELTGCNTEGRLQTELLAVMDALQGHDIRPDELETACHSKGPPLCYLPLALRILEHDTGNIYLDPTDEMPAEPLEWSVEDMDYLIEQYAEATAINEKVELLLDWLSASPANLREVIILWNEYLVPQDRTG